MLKKKESSYIVCKRCIMDTSTSFISFDKDGICNYCKIHDEMEKEFKIGSFDVIKNQIVKKGKKKKYNCVIGVSGGRDSTYTVYLARKIGLRPLLVHFNDGFGNPQAGKNIMNIIKKTNYKLITITSDWNQSKDIKIACLKASIPELHLGTDIGIMSSLYSVADRNNIKFILTGTSFRTEGIAPLDWNFMDGKYLKDIVKKHGTIRIKKLSKDQQRFNLTLKEMCYYAIFKRIKNIPIIYYFDYNLNEVDKIIENEFNWVSPGEHYFDDLYQSLLNYVHRKKFKFEFRRFNFSALIRSGQLDRNQALEKIKNVSLIEKKEIIDLSLKRLNLTKNDLDLYISKKPTDFRSFNTSYNLIKLLKYPIKILSKFNVLHPATYQKFFG